MNIITDPWIPVIRKNGTTDIISPLEILSKPKNPIIWTNFARIDLNAAAIKLIISLFTTFMAPKNSKEWLELYKRPQINTSLFKPRYFNLKDFLQDNKPNELDKILNVCHLFFNTPGEKTILEKKDFFHQATLSTLCPSCIIPTLYLKQYSAIMGGAGYQTSITAGANGALTTFIKGSNLWETIWNNVLPQTYFNNIGDLKGTLFPWTVDTVNSTLGSIDLNKTHPLYPLWEMPCRISLILEKNESTSCTLCDNKAEIIVSNFKCRNQGNKYTNPRHFFSPSTNKKTFLKPETNNTYSNIISYLIPTKNTTPSKNIEHFINMIDNLKPEKIHLWSFGYHMNQARFLHFMEEYITFPSIICNDKEFTSQIALYSFLVGVSIVNEIRKTQHAETSNPELLIEFMKVTEPIFHEVLQTKNIENWLDSMIIKSFDLFTKYIGNLNFGYLKFIRERFIDTINKKVCKPLKIEPLDNLDFYYIEYKRLNLPYFKRQFSKSLLSWLGKLKASKKYQTFSKADSLETILNEPIFNKFTKEMKPIYPNINIKVWAAALLVIADANNYDFSETFPRQIYLQGITEDRLNNLLSISDVSLEWNIFREFIKMFESYNVISFLEGFVYWNSKVKKYWKKIYLENT